MLSLKKCVILSAIHMCQIYTDMYLYIYANLLRHVKNATSKVTLCSHEFYCQRYFSICQQYFLDTCWVRMSTYNFKKRSSASRSSSGTNTRGWGGISGMKLVQVCRWASSYPPYKCILEYGKRIPINVYTIMEDNKKCSLFPFKLSCLMQKIISTVKCWIINWFLSENNKITCRDKGQVVKLSTAGYWMEDYKCIFEMKSWPIDV